MDNAIMNSQQLWAPAQDLYTQKDMRIEGVLIWKKKGISRTEKEIKESKNGE